MESERQKSRSQNKTKGIHLKLTESLVYYFSSQMILEITDFYDFMTIFGSLVHVPGSAIHRRGRGCCRVAPVRLGAEGPLGLEELAEVGWVQCWASSVRLHKKR